MEKGEMGTDGGKMKIIKGVLLIWWVLGLMGSALGITYILSRGLMLTARSLIITLLVSLYGPINLHAVCKAITEKEN